MRKSLGIKVFRFLKKKMDYFFANYIGNFFGEFILDFFSMKTRSVAEQPASIVNFTWVTPKAGRPMVMVGLRLKLLLFFLFRLPPAA
jgi:hypothetical protein